MKEPKSETLRFRCGETLANQVRAVARAQRRDVPQMLRIILEDWAAAQQCADSALREDPVRYTPPRNPN